MMSSLMGVSGAGFGCWLKFVVAGTFVGIDIREPSLWVLRDERSGKH